MCAIPGQGYFVSIASRTGIRHLTQFCLSIETIEGNQSLLIYNKLLLLYVCEASLSIPFSRSTRSLVLDSFRPGVIAMLLAILILASLIIWFIAAKVTIYQSSETASLKQDGMIEASFTAEGFATIKPGQKALLRLGQGPDSRPISIPTSVFDTGEGKDRVLLLITDYSALPFEITDELNGRVDIEVEYISPLELVMRATGQFLNRGGVSSNSTSPSNSVSP